MSGVSRTDSGDGSGGTSHHDEDGLVYRLPPSAWSEHRLFSLPRSQIRSAQQVTRFIEVENERRIGSA